MRRLVIRRPLESYFVLAYAIAWAYWVPLLLEDRGWISVPWSSHLPGLVAPLIAAVIVTAVCRGSSGLRDLGSRIIRWRVGTSGLVLALSPLAGLLVAAAIVAPFVGWLSWDALGRFEGYPDIGPLGLWLALVVVNGLGEEAGWRGFAHQELVGRIGFRRAVTTVAVLWALWHLPLFFFYEGFRQIPLFLVPGWFVGIGAGAVVLAWIYQRTRSSVLVVSVWHGSYNLAAASDAADGAIGAIVTAGVIVAAIYLMRRRVGRESTVATTSGPDDRDTPELADVSGPRP